MRSRDVVELVERGQVDRAERRDLAVEAVDLALQARQLARRLRSMPCAERARGRPAPACSCSRYCAPPSCAACSSSCSLVIFSRSGSRLCSSARRCSSARFSWRCRSSYSLRARGQRCSRSSLQRQRRLQAGLRRASSSVAELLRAAARRRAGRWPTCCAAVSMRALQLAAPRRAASAPRTALPAPARSSARSCSRASASSALGRAITRFVELGMALLRVGELQVELLEARLAGRAGARSALRAGRRSRPSSSSSCARRARGGLGLLRQAQQLDLQLVRARSAPRPPRGARRPGAATASV